MSRLVLVEGLPGAGKSTTAQHLVLHAGRHGHRARWSYEEEAAHPVTGSYHPSAAPLARWAAFVRAARDADELIVLESALLQWPIMALLRHDLAPEAILAVVGEITVLLAPLDPLLVYLSLPDVEAAVRAIGARRGAAWQIGHIVRNDATPFARRRGVSGFEGLVHYWREHAALCERAVAAWPYQKLVLDVSRGDWPTRRREICRLLALPLDEHPPAGEAQLQRYVGTYRGLLGGKPREFAIAVKERRLVLQGLLWPENPLIPGDSDLFHAEAWPLALRFVDDGRGDIRAVSIEGPPFRWGDVAGACEKVT